MCQTDDPLLAATREQYCIAREALVIQSAYSQIFEKGNLNLSVNSWIKSWQESALLLTVDNVLKPKNKNRLHLEAMHQRQFLSP